MAPPQANPNCASADEGMPAAVPFPVQTLKKRADFLRASRAARTVTPGFVLQMRIRNADEPDGMRVGFTCSKKVGNAVARNRAKRRLREIARHVLPTAGLENADYVLVGRRDTTTNLAYDKLTRDLQRAVVHLHGQLK